MPADRILQLDLARGEVFGRTCVTDSGQAVKTVGAKTMEAERQSATSLANARPQTLKTIAALTLTLVLVVSRRSEAQQFYDMGSLNGQDGQVVAISADGSTVVGYLFAAHGWGYEPVIWTREGDLQMLPFPPGSTTCRTNGVTSDGRTIVGSTTSRYLGSSDYVSSRPVVWHDRVPSFLPSLPGMTRGRAEAISGDGRRIAGVAWPETEPTQYYEEIETHGVLWVDGVPTEIGQNLSARVSRIETMSRDGNTVILYGYHLDGVYRSDNGVYTRLTAPGLRVSTVPGISADGAVVVGDAYNGNYYDDNQALRWFEGVTEPQFLGVPAGATTAFAKGVSSDGNTVLGRATFCASGGSSDCHSEAWRWTPTNGFELIRDVLISESLGPKITGWSLDEAVGVSDDGKVIIGQGVNRSGISTGWIADLHHVPPNDTCDRPIFIGQGPIPDYAERRTTGTTEDASSDGASTCGFGGGPDVWYEFSSPHRGYLELELCGSELINPVISIHRGCPGGSFNQVFCANDCDDPGCDGACIDRPWIPIEPGADYLIRVASDKGYPGGLFTLVSRFVPHADDCADAPLVAVPSTTRGITTLATVDPVDQCDATPVTAPGVWYRVIGTGATMTASLCGAADYDTKLSLYCGGCEAPTCLAQNDDACGLQSEISWCSAPGQQYYILVHGYNTSAGSFELSVSSSGPACGFTWNCAPVNDECDRALPLVEGTTLLDNGSAQTDSGQTSCGGVANDLWHSYMPACSGTVTIDTCQPTIGTLGNTVISVLDACDGTELRCNDDYADAQVDCGFRSAVDVPATAGQEVLIRSGGHPTLQQTGTYPLRITELPAAVVVFDLTAGLDVGVPVDIPLEARGGCPPFITDEGNGYFVSAEGLPPGLSVDSYVHVRGTPLYSGRYTATVDVADREITTPGDTATLDILIAAPNDDCADALPIREGSIPFGNHNLSTDGPEETEACAAAGITQIERDEWFQYQSSCDGIATIDLCESTLDATLAVYDGADCPTVPGAILCDHNACGATPRSTLRVSQGGQYLIRVGGYSGAEGNGVLTITCFNDCNDNGIDDTLEIDNFGLPVLAYHPVDFSAHHNANMQADLDPAFPSGSVTLGGVPFVIPEQGNNYWHSVVAVGPNPRSIDIPVNRFGVSEVHTLINTYWGVPGPTSYASLEFFGSDGAYFLKELVGNEDIRDFNDFVFTNAINNTTTVNVVSVGPHRLDKQRIALPAAFHNQTLEMVKLNDFGTDNVQRVFLAGITVLAEARANDCNGNRRPDECDVEGDADGSGVVDLGDWPMLRHCLTGPQLAYANACCAWFDHDSDDDIDLADLAYFQARQGWNGLPCVQTPNGLIGWWSGDDTFADWAGTNDAVPINGATFGPGYVDAGMVTGPGAVYAQTSSNIATTGSSPRTLCAWVKSSRDYASSCCATPASYGAGYPGGGFGIFISFGQWWFWGYQNDIDTGVRVDTNWNHHCITYDGTDVVYYINGDPVASQPQSLNTGSSPLVIGDGFDHRFDTPFEGIVDEVMLYDRALQLSEVRRLHEAGTAGVCR